MTYVKFLTINEIRPRDEKYKNTMKRIRTAFTTASLFFLLLFNIEQKMFAQLETNPPQPHPRILLLKGEEELIKKSISSNKTWNKMHSAILNECDNLLGKEVLERKKIGRRLLATSKECFRRVFYLSYAYRMTGEEKYFLRAEREMLQISQFSDWNPSHFLDVAEMTMGIAIGYDWLFHKLSPESKKIISQAIIEKGLKPSFGEKVAWAFKTDINWNQVCNTGMTYGAFAVYEDSPALAESIIKRAIDNIPRPMKSYAPDGAYPEGYGYWLYGTTYNVLFLSAIEKCFSTDYGLSQAAGFLKTPDFFLHMTGITGYCYNWGDTDLNSRLSAAMFWFAQKTNNPSLLWLQKDHLKSDDLSRYTTEPYLPALMIWGKDILMDTISEPTSKVWTGKGSNPVCLMRTSWSDPNGIYLGFKAGSASVSHGHMDVGSFMMEADGMRWASDFPRQEYNSLESKGINVFGLSQNAQRWTIFRANNFSHNTLTINQQLQQVKGKAKIDKYSDQPAFSYAISDLSSVYEDQLKSTKRGVGIVESKYVIVRDEVIAGDKAATVRWNMLTTASVEISGINSITLTQEGKKLFFEVKSPVEVSMKIWSTAPTTDYDAPNPGTCLMGFELSLKANEKVEYQVNLIPESSSKDKIDFNKPLDKW